MTDAGPSAWSRRAFVSSAVAVGATPALGQDAEAPPRCTGFETFGDWAVWSGSRILPTGGDPLSLQLGGKDVTFTAVVKSRTAGKTVTWAGVAEDTSLGGHPWIAFEDSDQGTEMTLQFGVLRDVALQKAFEARLANQPGTAVFTADGTEVGRYNGIRSNIFSAPIDKSALMQIAAQTQRLSLSFYVGDVAEDTLYSQQDYALGALADAFAALETFHAEHVNTVKAAGECVSGCAMTTAAVDLLGRSDDCFELTQMRRLRGSFPEYDWVVRDYLESSGKLLARPGPALTFGLLTFYAGVVWPNALLVALGLKRSAGHYYLGGFRVLKFAMGVR